MTRTVNRVTIEHVKRWEGLRLTAYPDPGSRDGTPWTIGYGHTGDAFMAVRKGMTITKEQAEAALENDLNETAAGVERLVTVPLSDNQFGALVSFAFNVGLGAFKASTLLKKLNAGDYDAVPAQLVRWTKNDGKEMQGLVNRRKAEAELWTKPAPGAVPIPIPARPIEQHEEPIAPPPAKRGRDIGIIATVVLFALAAGTAAALYFFGSL